MEYFLAGVIVLAIVVSVYYPYIKLIQEIKARGAMRERDNLMILQKHSFYSKKVVDIDVLYHAMDKTYFQTSSPMLLSIQVRKEARDYIFSCDFNFNGEEKLLYKVLRWELSEEPECIFVLHMQQYPEEYCYQFFLEQSQMLQHSFAKMYRKLNYNIILTSLENAFKMLDPEVEVERKIIE